MRRNQEPLSAKYPHFSGYSAFGSNPIYFTDPDGRDIIPQNLDEKQIKILNANIIELRSWNSPTVNKIIDLAESKKALIHMYFLSQNKPVQETRNAISYIGWNIGEFWKKTDDLALGATFMKHKNSIFHADILLQTENMEKGYSLENNKLNENTISPLVLIDELNHAISTNKPTNDGFKEKEALDHQNLFQNLLNEINEGDLKVSNTIKWQIEGKLIQANKRVEDIKNETKK